MEIGQKFSNHLTLLQNCCKTLIPVRHTYYQDAPEENNVDNIDIPLMSLSKIIWQHLSVKIHISAMMSGHTHTIFSTAIYNVISQALKRNFWSGRKRQYLQISLLQMKQTLYEFGCMPLANLFTYHFRQPVHITEVPRTLILSWEIAFIKDLEQVKLAF